MKIIQFVTISLLLVISILLMLYSVNWSFKMIEYVFLWVTIINLIISFIFHINVSEFLEEEFKRFLAHCIIISLFFFWGMFFIVFIYSYIWGWNINGHWEIAFIWHSIWSFISWIFALFIWWKHNKKIKG